MSSCLLQDEALDNQNNKVFDDEHNDPLNKRLAYLTSLDLMRTLIALHPSKWSSLLIYLRDNNILVIERYDLSIVSIECTMYEHGLKYVLRDEILYKGQSDATFVRKNGGGKIERLER